MNLIEIWSTFITMIIIMFQYVSLLSIMHPDFRPHFGFKKHIVGASTQAFTKELIN